MGLIQRTRREQIVCHFLCSLALSTGRASHLFHIRIRLHEFKSRLSTQHLQAPATSKRIIIDSEPKVPFLFPFERRAHILTHYRPLVDPTSTFRLTYDQAVLFPFCFGDGEKHAWYIYITHRLPVVHTFLARLTGFKFCASTPNATQQHATGAQTDATCEIQQCWEFLANNAVLVCMCSQHDLILGK